METKLTLSYRELECLSDQTRDYLSLFRTNRNNEFVIKNDERKMLQSLMVLVRNIEQDVETAKHDGRFIGADFGM